MPISEKDLTLPARCSSIYPPGIGGAERTTDPAAFALDQVVDDAVAVLDHLRLQRVPVLGLSMGGSHGLWMAARYPERVERMVLIGSVEPAWAFGADPAWQRLIAMPGLAETVTDIDNQILNPTRYSQI